ncbi:MAG: tetratricopeptide repeat protein [Woeseiaceae bacterium]|nr:tetratricopeptide repeat protein [Woeseiaceae bacterium]
MNFEPNTRCRVLLAALLLAASPATPSEETKTVIGPRNIDLYDGANALMAGDGEEGVRLTLRGLQLAQGPREEKIGHSNLCAGYLLINQPEEALPHCDWVLERDDTHWRTHNNRALVYMRLERFEEAQEDIRKGQELRPGSKNLKIVKGMYLDETQPVRTNIEVDDRRSAAEKPGDERPADVAD